MNSLSEVERWSTEDVRDLLTNPYESPIARQGALDELHRRRKDIAGPMGHGLIIGSRGRECFGIIHGPHDFTPGARTPGHIPL